ncbi:MAG: hypothetical protein L6V91_08560 [Bacilli bacterium]|nr:MAG: hypothetical protein L6V91_08560 [Bacilli bacterium]
MITVESLEIHVSNHCNLSCRGCSHISPLEKKRIFLNEEKYVFGFKKIKFCFYIVRLLDCLEGSQP